MFAACIEAYYCSRKSHATMFINGIIKYITKRKVHMANDDEWYIILNCTTLVFIIGGISIF